jgi:predicted RNase H-like nuclease (RuvC/YqgF family)
MNRYRDLKDLLAVIHRDGGHHTAQVGVTQSVRDAHNKWAALTSRAEAAETKLAYQIKAAVVTAEYTRPILEKVSALEKETAEVVADFEKLGNENRQLREKLERMHARADSTIQVLSARTTALCALLELPDPRTPLPEGF